MSKTLASCDCRKVWPRCKLYEGIVNTKCSTRRSLVTSSFPFRHRLYESCITSQFRSSLFACTVFCAFLDSSHVACIQLVVQKHCPFKSASLTRMWQGNESQDKSGQGTVLFILLEALRLRRRSQRACLVSMRCGKQHTLVSILSRCWRASSTISAVLTKPDKNPTLLSTNLQPYCRGFRAIQQLTECPKSSSPDTEHAPWAGQGRQGLHVIAAEHRNQMCIRTTESQQPAAAV